MSVIEIKRETHGCGRAINCMVCVSADMSPTGKAYWEVQPIDFCLANAVDALTAIKVLTKSCCCGHGVAPGVIILHDGTKIEVPQCKKYTQKYTGGPQSAAPKP